MFTDYQPSLAFKPSKARIIFTLSTLNNNNQSLKKENKEIFKVDFQSNHFRFFYDEIVRDFYRNYYAKFFL